MPRILSSVLTLTVLAAVTTSTTTDAFLLPSLSSSLSSNRPCLSRRQTPSTSPAAGAAAGSRQYSLPLPPSLVRLQASPIPEPKERTEDKEEEENVDKKKEACDNSSSSSSSSGENAVTSTSSSSNSQVQRDFDAFLTEGKDVLGLIDLLKAHESAITISRTQLTSLLDVLSNTQTFRDNLLDRQARGLLPPTERGSLFLPNNNINKNNNNNDFMANPGRAFMYLEKYQKAQLESITYIYSVLKKM